MVLASHAFSLSLPVCCQILGISKCLRLFSDLNPPNPSVAVSFCGTLVTKWISISFFGSSYTLTLFILLRFVGLSMSAMYALLPVLEWFDLHKADGWEVHNWNRNGGSKSGKARFLVVDDGHGILVLVVID